MGLQSLLLLVVVTEDLFLVAERDEIGREGNGGEKGRKVTKWQKGPSAGEKMKEAGNRVVGRCAKERCWRIWIAGGEKELWSCEGKMYL